MKLMLAPKMNCVLILLDRTNAILYRVSLRLSLKMQKNTKLNMEQTAFRVEQYFMHGRIALSIMQAINQL